MTAVTEIAPDTFRISTFVPQANLQFNQFLVRDDEPLLFHSGGRAIFPAVRDAVATLIDPAKTRWIGFSHLEADECGSLREWESLAPNATAVCSLVGKFVSVDDFVAARPAKGLGDGDLLSTGSHQFRFLATPHVPHCWEAGLLFDETTGTLFCSDLFHQNGDVEPLTSSDVVERFRRTLIEYGQGPLSGYIPYTNRTERTLRRLADLKPRTLAAMHGSTFVGDGERAIGDLSLAMREVLAGE